MRGYIKVSYVISQMVHYRLTAIVQANHVIDPFKIESIFETTERSCQKDSLKIKDGKRHPTWIYAL